MPPLATSLVDTKAVELIAAWITNDLPSHLTYAEWQVANFGSTNAPDSEPAEDADGDRALNYFEYLTATDPNAATNFWGITAQPAIDGVAILYPQIANRAFEIQLVDWFLHRVYDELNGPLTDAIASIPVK
jgi:hypothetical protein